MQVFSFRLEVSYIIYSIIFYEVNKLMKGPKPAAHKRYIERSREPTNIYSNISIRSGYLKILTEVYFYECQRRIVLTEYLTYVVS